MRRVKRSEDVIARLASALSATLAVLLAGCGADASGGLGVEVSASPVPLDRLLVSAISPGDGAFLVRDQPFPARVPGRIVIDPSGRRESVRVVVSGERAGVRVAFGYADIDVAPGVDRTARVTLEAPPPADTDADGLPDPADPRFDTVAPGTAFPPDGRCETLLRRGFEPRPENAAANATEPPADFSLVSWPSGNPLVNTSIRPRIGGHFTGTTDEILQWAACRWGLDEDVVRAFALVLTQWRQTRNTGGSLGIFGINPQFAGGTEEWAGRSTAFNADYVIGWWRACYEGYWTWIEQPQPGSGYGPGDALGCLGMWWSGRWYDDTAREFLGRLEAARMERKWLEGTF